MFRFMLLFIFNTILCGISVQNYDGQRDSEVQFICGKNKYLSKCGCGQATDEFTHIPLFAVDCSRLEFQTCPPNKVLPLLMGHLDLSHNNIRYLNGSTQLSSDTLQYLDFSYNKINSISHGYFKNLTQLRYLNLEHNRLGGIESNLFDGLKKLTTLNLQSNQLKMLPQGIFEHLKSLDELVLSHNDLGQFMEHIQLYDYLPENTITLHLDYINLKNITDQLFDKLYHLRKLSITNNNIQKLPHLALNYLELLDISSTNISILSPQNLNFPHLKVLKLNRLPYLTNISDFTFFNLKELQELEIEHCVRLKIIEPLAFGFLKLENKTNQFFLKKVSIAHNSITTLKDSFEFILDGLEEINLSGNEWICDCKLGWIRSLKKSLKNNADTRCSEPEELQNKIISELSNRDLPCYVEKKFSSPNVSLRNGLFVLVGVLSLIVLGLVACLAYMGPYGDYLHSWSRSIGPESPYCQITIQPNKAEYSDVDDAALKENENRY